MNLRIRELMNQAVFSDQIPYPSQEQVFQKFAELLVRECAVMCRWEHEAQVMLEHFGVEE